MLIITEWRYSLTDELQITVKGHSKNNGYFSEHVAENRWEPHNDAYP